MAYGDLSFMQSLSLIARQRDVVARLMFAEPIDARGASRRDLTRLAEARIASLLGLPVAGSEPRTTGGPPGAPP